jgi:hypothetical protein
MFRPRRTKGEKKLTLVSVWPDANGSKRIQITSEMRQSARDAVSLSHRFIVSYIVGAKGKHEL